jgi:hypothetical protein
LAIGADDANAALGDRSAELLLQLAPLSSGLAEAGGQHDRKWNAGLAAVADGLRHTRGRNGDDGQVAGRPDRRDIRIAREPVQLAVLGVDEKNRAGVAGVLQPLDRLAADAGEIRGRADDGNAAGLEQALEAQGGPPAWQPRHLANSGCRRPFLVE